LIKEGGEAQVEAEDRYGGERYTKGERKRFIKGFLQTINVLSGVEDRKIYEGVDGDSRLP
jgi:hypothetical protein